MALDLRGARRVVEKLMSETCVVTRPADAEDAGTFDDATGAITEPAAASIFTGPCMLSSRTARVVTPGGQIVTESYWSAMLPSSAPIILESDVLTITKVGSLSDPTLLGRIFVVDNVVHSSFLAGRVFDLTSTVPTEPRDA